MECCGSCVQDKKNVPTPGWWKWPGKGCEVSGLFSAGEENREVARTLETAGGYLSFVLRLTLSFKCISCIFRQNLLPLMLVGKPNYHSKYRFADTTQHWKKQIIQWKVGRRHGQTFLQRRHPDGQQIHEKILIITYHQGNPNQNHNEISPHIGQNG